MNSDKYGKHGVFQLLSGWADEPEFEIRPGNIYKYRFNLTGQEGTLWWHAHVSWLRATVHGALIIRPKRGRSYPFPKPYKEPRYKHTRIRCFGQGGKQRFDFIHSVPSTSESRNYADRAKSYYKQVMP
ncbi:hypothetical protein RND71_026299 [Anisodus tanguticus]|uniref:Plastocyanin-like domain-containing protein n=1 Tax=Anisodus tanguticus TaxID=243964 RepID=A0AAE1RM51_9SOLA|nr:hypothetical protein RND71_026299 [Anisodus tanguticus]